MFQYYEMSYGLNVEMHKQVCTHSYLGQTLILILFDCKLTHIIEIPTWLTQSYLK